MAHPYHHALSSAKQMGRERPEDYQPIHQWFDKSKIDHWPTFVTALCATMLKDASCRRGILRPYDTSSRPAASCRSD